MTPSSYSIIQLKSDNADLTELLEFLVSSYFYALDEENKSSLNRELRRTDISKKEQLKSYLEQLIGMEQHACIFIAKDTSTAKCIGYFVGVVKECLAEIPSRMGYINGLYVNPESRRKHVGQLLFDTGMKWFHDNNMSLVELYVSTGNRDAKAFWKKNGFVLNEEIWVRPKN